MRWLKMDFRKWWKSRKSWVKGVLIGGLFGLLKIPFFAIFGEYIAENILKLFEFPDIYICKLFDISGTESCGFFALFYGFTYNSIFYGIVGGLIAFLIARLLKK